MVDAHRGRILLVTASARRRGAEIQATQLAPHLTDLGWRVDVVALHAGTDGTALGIDTLGRRRLGPSALRALHGRAQEVDLVVAYGSATLPACAMGLAGTGTPFLYRSISDPSHWLRGPLHRSVTRLQYRRAVGCVALWPGAADHLAADLDVDPARITVIPNARDPHHFRPASADERAAARRRFEVGGEPVVAFVGAASPEKRLDLAIETLTHLPDHLLLVAGVGDGLPAAKALAANRLGGRVRFLGEVEDVRAVLHASDVVLITSEVEGMPGVAIEATLCAVPVVATPVGALPTMPGVRLSTPTPIALAAAIGDAYTSPPPDPCLARPFTWREVAGSWSDLLTATIRA